MPWLVHDCATNTDTRALWLSVGPVRHLLHPLVILQLYWAVEIAKKYTGILAPAA